LPRRSRGDTEPIPEPIPEAIPESIRPLPAPAPEDAPDKLRVMEFVEPEDEPGHFRNPLPPDDRLWRHPSEVGSSEVGSSEVGSSEVGAGAGGSMGGGGSGTGPAGEHVGDRVGDPLAKLPAGDEARPSMWLVAAVSAVSAGLLASGLALVVVGLMGSNELRPAVERQMEPRPIDAVIPGGVVDVAGRARAAVAQVRLDGHSTVAGSGVIFRSDGHLLTSAAVVGDATSVRVTLDSGREVGGRVLGSDPETDVAVVKLEGDGPFPTAVLGTADDLQVGQQVVAIGWPVGLVGGPSVTVGVISALHRSVRRGVDGGMLFDMVQTDARVPTGWPGGALLDSSGSVIGITTSLGTTGPGPSTVAVSDTGGFGFAVPIDLARAVADQIITSGRVTGVWLGVQGSDLDWVSAARLAVPGGAMVAEVKGGSPAERAGLSASDIIVGLDGVPVTSMGQLMAALRRHRAGDTIRVDLLRDQQSLSMVVVLVERPTPA
jgi:S1-C subfamily serine protease